MKTKNEEDANEINELTPEQEIDRIKQLAEQMDVPFYEDRKLIEVLLELDLEERIPESFAGILSELVNLVDKDEV